MNERIVIDPGIHHGQPVIKGTRVSVTRVLGSLAGGASFEEICEDYGVTDEDIRAAIAFANELVAEQAFYPALTR
jgi:uncharacterized protein (DUF433 family)